MAVLSHWWKEDFSHVRVACVCSGSSWHFCVLLKYSWWEIPWRSTGRTCFESSTSTNALLLDSGLVINEHRPSLTGVNLIAAQYQNMKVLLLTVETKRCGGKHHWYGLEGGLESKSLTELRLEGGWDRNEGGVVQYFKEGFILMPEVGSLIQKRAELWLEEWVAERNWMGWDRKAK